MKKERKITTNINVGCVFKCEIEEAVEIKNAFLKRDDIKLVYFKTSNDKIWIMVGDGENPDE